MYFLSDEVSTLAYICLFLKWHMGKKVIDGEEMWGQGQETEVIFYLSFSGSLFLAPFEQLKALFLEKQLNKLKDKKHMILLIGEI